MNRLRFLDPQGREVEPPTWVCSWAGQYSDDDYDPNLYWALIGKQGSLSTSDFELVGRWKERAVAKDSGKWKPNVAMVAYEIFMQAVRELPKEPEENRVTEFLEDWSERKCHHQYNSGQTQTKSFGLSRATTLLHFVSAGRYPIFDSRVRKAVGRLLGAPTKNRAVWYKERYCPLFEEIASVCGVNGMEGRRLLDKALFCYGEKGIF